MPCVSSVHLTIQIIKGQSSCQLQCFIGLHVCTRMCFFKSNIAQFRQAMKSSPVTMLQIWVRAHTSCCLSLSFNHRTCCPWTLLQAPVKLTSSLLCLSWSIANLYWQISLNLLARIIIGWWSISPDIVKLKNSTCLVWIDVNSSWLPTHPRWCSPDAQVFPVAGHQVCTISGGLCFFVNRLCARGLSLFPRAALRRVMTVEKGHFNKL